MKKREGLVRINLFKVREKQRQLDQLDAMIVEFERMSAELKAQISHEESKSGIRDSSHFAYPTFAHAVRQRLSNVQISIHDLYDQRSAAEIVLHEAKTELEKARALEARGGRVLADDELVFVQRRSLFG